MRTTIAAFMGVLAMTVSTSAHADWQYTKWGMNVDEVIRASSGTAFAAKDEERSFDLGSTRAAVAKYKTTDGYEFNVNFFFNNASHVLDMVELIWPNGRTCDNVVQRVENTYGPAGVSKTDPNAGKTYKWWDSQHRNFLVLTAFGECTLTYQKWEEAGADGNL